MAYMVSYNIKIHAPVSCAIYISVLGRFPNNFPSLVRKFAASPAVVVLCGMAAGAGFGSLENVQYVAKAR